MNSRENGGVDDLPTLKPEVAKLVEKSLLPVEQARAGVPTRGSGTDAQNTVVKEGLQQTLLWLKFCGLSNREVAKRLSLSKDCVNRFVKSEYFTQLYENNRTEMCGRVSEASMERLQEITLEALEKKIHLMRTARSPDLQNKIASELMALGLEAARGSGTGATSAIIAVYERARKRKLPTGETVVEKVTLTGEGPGSVDPRGDGFPPWPDSGPSQKSGEDWPEEAQSGSGKGRMDERQGNEGSEPETDGTKPD